MIKPLTETTSGMTKKMENNENKDSPRGYHDIGGDKAGEIPKMDLPWLHWEKQTEAVRNLLGDGTRRIVSLDEMRRGFESFGDDKYKSLSFYRRRLDAMIDILIEKRVISQGQLDEATLKGRAIWEKEQSKGKRVD